MSSCIMLKIKNPLHATDIKVYGCIYLGELGEKLDMLGESARKKMILWAMWDKASVPLPGTLRTWTSEGLVLQGRYADDE